MKIEPDKEMKCKLCGFIHNGSKEAIEYHKGKCVEDRKAELRDPFCLGERSIENISVKVDEVDR